MFSVTVHSIMVEVKSEEDNKPDINSNLGGDLVSVDVTHAFTTDEVCI